MRDHCPDCGAVLERKRRSGQHHRFFFSAVSGAFANWPIEHRFLPSSEEHLRAWLLIQAGHCNVIGQSLTAEADIFRVADFTERLMTDIRKHGSFGFVEVVSRKSLAVRYPKSISYRDLSQTDFQPIASKVFDIIEAEIGVPVDQLVREHEAAA